MRMIESIPVFGTDLPKCGMEFLSFLPIRLDGSVPTFLCIYNEDWHQQIHLLSKNDMTKTITFPAHVL